MWEGAGEMHQITGKLTRPKNFKTKAQLLKEKKLRENREKQRIREEILATTPVTDDDTSSYSTYLASRSSQSKSEVEIKEQQEKQALIKAQRALEAKQKAEAEAERERKEQEKLAAEEAAQIKQGELVRIQKKNEIDLQNMEDLKNLDKLQRSGE